MKGEYLMSEVMTKGKLAKDASLILLEKTTEEKNDALAAIAEQLRDNQEKILQANEQDLTLGKEQGLTDAALDRIMLDESRVQGMIDSIQSLIGLEDPIGEVLESHTKENGLVIERARVPLGVVGMIYENRPNVTVDASTLALKTNNAIILRGSSSAIHSNKVLVEIIHKALESCDFPKDAVQLIEDPSRETAKELFTLNEYLDVLIPRGGQNLIDVVVRESTVPVIETGAGNCHLYIDEDADVSMAETVTLNAKIQRPSVCNAIETLLIHQKWFQDNGVALLKALEDQGVEIIGDEVVKEKFPSAKLATEDDWYTEYLALKLSVKVVQSVDEAIQHILTCGTKHSEGIVTSNEENAQRFLQNVDASSVYHNASTRFTDGFEFGYGAEIGISTQKLHARGPMGLHALTSSKFIIKGSGQIRQ